MKKLSKITSFLTTARVFERSRNRCVIVRFIPPNLIGLRLEGTQREFCITANAAYDCAVKWGARNEKQLANGKDDTADETRAVQADLFS